MDEIDFALMPHWAVGTTTGICVGAQLPTKDGRRTGNAVVTGRRLTLSSGVRTWAVLTDAGNSLVLCDEEIKQLFYDPKWVMNVDSCPGKQRQQGADDQLKEVEEYLERNAMKHAFEIDEFHEAMRPSPKQTLKQIALQMLVTIEASKQFIPEITSTIRKAIKALPNE
jgi:hypothetical protein